MNYQPIKLLGGVIVQVDLDSHQTTCSKCKKLIRFGITTSGKYMPVIKIGDSWQSHFTDCKFANTFRKTKIDEIEEEETNQELLNSL